MYILFTIIFFCCTIVNAAESNPSKKLLQQPAQAQESTAIPYIKLNNLLGMPLFGKNDLWSEKLNDIQRRLMQKRIFFYNNKDKNGIQISPCRGNISLQGVPIEEIRIQTKEQNGTVVPVRIDLILTNKGDSQNTSHLRRDIRKSEKTLVPVFDAKLGKSIKTYYGPSSMKQEAQCWNTPQAVFMLESVRREYIILHIQPPVQKHISRHTFSQKLQTVKNLNLVDNVENTSFGDAYIKNIPLVMQGEKGYCVVACMERILLYYGIDNVNMHQMADAAQTHRDNGTSAAKMHSSLNGVFKQAGIQVKTLSDINIRTLKNYINKGYPILWCMYHSDEYEQRRWNNTEARKNAGSTKAWKKQLKKQKMLPVKDRPHACLIIGYNEATEELAVSNSWGAREKNPTWISLRDAKRISQPFSYVYIMPRNEKSTSRMTSKKN